MTMTLITQNYNLGRRSVVGNILNLLQFDMLFLKFRMHAKNGVS